MPHTIKFSSDVQSATDFFAVLVKNGQFWNTDTPGWEDYDSANIADYMYALTYRGLGVYTEAVDAVIPTSTDPITAIVKRGAGAETDPTYGAEEINEGVKREITFVSDTQGMMDVYALLFKNGQFYYRDGTAWEDYNSDHLSDYKYDLTHRGLGIYTNSDAVPTSTDAISIIVKRGTGSESDVIYGVDEELTGTNSSGFYDGFF